jgi:hypothetical protein
MGAQIASTATGETTSESEGGQGAAWRLLGVLYLLLQLRVDPVPEARTFDADRNTARLKSLGGLIHLVSSSNAAA